MWVLAGCALTIVSCGCAEPSNSAPSSRTSTSPAQPSVDAILQYTNRWIDNPAVDLLSSEGTFVRAAMESLDRISMGKGTGKGAIEDAGYPGFLHAFNSVRDAEKYAGIGRKDQAQVGTLYREVVSFRRDGNGFTAGICTYESMTATEVYTGYRTSGTSLPAGSAIWLTFGPDPNIGGERQTSPLTNQHGPPKYSADRCFWQLGDYGYAGARCQRRFASMQQHASSWHTSRRSE